MNSRITLEESYSIIHKIDLELSVIDLEDSLYIYGEYQPEKELTKLKIEIFAYAMIYICKVAFQEISMAEAMLLGGKEQRKSEFYINFSRALAAYYPKITEQQLSNLVTIVKKKEDSTSMDDLDEYLSNYISHISILFTDVSNEYLNTNPLEIQDYVTANYKSVEGLNFNFDMDIKTIIKSDAYHKYATLKNEYLPYIFSSYAILCLKKLHCVSPFVSINMVDDIGNDIWNCLITHLPNYSSYKEEYTERLNREILNVHSIRHAINLMKLNDIYLISP